MKIAITSANGQLGRAVVKRAIEVFGADNVVGLARTPEKAKDLGVEIRKGDYDKQKDFEKSLQDIEVVVILSGNAHPDDRIGQHRNIINGAKIAGVRKIIYGSIFGDEGKCSFDAIIKSNRQTEADIVASGLDYAISRNGLYLEPDIEYLENYVKAGEIMNSAGEGRCGYTTRDELAYAYMKLAATNDLNGGAYNLFGDCITQQELTNEINQVFGTDLKYHAISVEDYKKDRVAEHGAYFGELIGGIYEGIYNGVFDLVSDYEIVAGRPHASVREMIEGCKNK